MAPNCSTEQQPWGTELRWCQSVNLLLLGQQLGVNLLPLGQQMGVNLLLLGQQWAVNLLLLGQQLGVLEPGRV